MSRDNDDGAGASDAAAPKIQGSPAETLASGSAEASPPSVAALSGVDPQSGPVTSPATSDPPSGASAPIHAQPAFDPPPSVPGDPPKTAEFDTAQSASEIFVPALPKAPRISLGARVLSGVRSLAKAAYEWSRTYFNQEPTFVVVVFPLLILSAILFTRLPNTNYIFDEQEALLANPYVNRTQGLKFIDAIHRDFWGLPPDRSVGSYRPIPNFLWRLAWHVTKQPFVHHFYNVLLHAVVGALITLFAYRISRRKDLSYIAGFLFVGCAVLTEAVSGIVGIADVVGGLGAVSALLALSLRGWAMPFAVFASLLFALFSKESGLVCVPLVPFAALLVAPLTHPERPARFLRMASAAIASVAAFVLYVELRKRWFPSPLPADLQTELPPEASQLKHLVRDFMVWFHQAPLPKDPLNNPLAEAPTNFRVAGALRVYARGVGQVLFPKTLSGDYSFPQEPVPTKLIFPESVIGASLMVLPLLAAAFFWILAMVRESQARVAVIARNIRLRRAAPELGSVDTFAQSLRDAESEEGALRPTDLTNALPDVPESENRWKRPVGLALVLLSIAAVALHVMVLRDRMPGYCWRFPIPFWIGQSENGPFWHAVPWSLAFLPLGLVGLGFIADTGTAHVRPDAKDAPVALGRAGILLAAIGLVWMVVSYFPHSNIPVVLPTVRAERFWYLPAIGTALVIAVAFAWAHDVAKKFNQEKIVRIAFVLFFGFQCVQAYRHAMDYRNDLVFWEATRDAVPNSSKAHLNYSVMKGARGDLETRLVESKEAMRLAPEWPMAHIYTGDTLCRMHRAEEAWPYYKKGFAIGPNEQSLISLALQCLYDEKNLYAHEAELRELAEAHPGSWIAYLAVDTLDNSEKHTGVDPKYRPRGYNEGPKE